MNVYLENHSGELRQKTKLDSKSYLLVSAPLQSIDDSQAYRLTTLTDSTLSSQCVR
jgi:hypothetical protein